MKTLIMIHGLGRTSRSMKRAAKFFKPYYNIVLLDYPRHVTLGMISANYLAPVVDKYPDCDFFTHSMGGIVLRTYLQDRPLPNSRVVMLAPPNKGSEIIDWLENHLPVLGRKVLGNAGMSLGTTGITRRLKKVDAQICVIAGDRTNIISNLFFTGVNDGKVSINSTLLEEMSSFCIIRVSHTFIMNNKKVLKRALQFLQGESDDKR